MNSKKRVVVLGALSAVMSLAGLAAAGAGDSVATGSDKPFHIQPDWGRAPEWKTRQGCDDIIRIQPYPNPCPKPCDGDVTPPDCPRRRWVPLGDDRPAITKEFGARAAEVNAAVGNQDFGRAAQSLGAVFDGSGFKANNAVYAGADALRDSVSQSRAVEGKSFLPALPEASRSAGHGLHEPPLPGHNDVRSPSFLGGEAPESAAEGGKDIGENSPAGRKEDRFILALENGDANPMQHDNAIVNGAAGAIAGSRGGVAGAVLGGIAGAVKGAYDDIKQKAAQDEKSYNDGNAARNRDRR